ncbi:MAG: Leu/Phe/Val dehydrogenase [Halarsenatibacteraceae bacterium]
MKIFEQMEKNGHEQVMFFQEEKTDLKAILAIHNTVLGPGLGGCRMWDYDSEDDALNDVLRLSKGMTYKAGISGEDFGGGKTVIWADPETHRTEGLFRVLGRYINSLGGRYSTGTDVGTMPEDFVLMRKETPYVGALPKEYGGGGDSSIPTAYGTLMGIKASCKYRYGSEDLDGKKIAIQGLGKVGYKLAELLKEEGAELVGTDVVEENIERAKELGMEIVEPDDIFDVDCDIFSPNALGAVINDDTINRFKCDIICGAANNVLAEKRHSKELEERDILYAPDYVVNAGGLILICDEMEPNGYSEKRTMKKTEGIYNTLLKVFKIADQEEITTDKAADHLVEERIETVATIGNIHQKN